MADVVVDVHIAGLSTPKVGPIIARVLESPLARVPKEGMIQVQILW